MKKLLALILCVMMLVAVVPTAAFAAGVKGNPYATTSASGFFWAWDDATNSKTIIKDNRDAIDTMLKGLAADQAVFGTVTAIDSMVSELAKSFFEGIDDIDGSKFSSRYVKTYHDDLVSNTKAFLRASIGDTINKYMKEHEGTFTSKKDVKDANGNVIGTRTLVDPEKYLNAFATAATKALNSKDAAKALEAFVYELAVMKTIQDVTDQQKDFVEAVKDWEDGSKILEAYGFAEVGSGHFWEPTAFTDPVKNAEQWWYPGVIFNS